MAVEGLHHCRCKVGWRELPVPCTSALQKRLHCALLAQEVPCTLLHIERVTDVDLGYCPESWSQLDVRMPLLQPFHC